MRLDSRQANSPAGSPSLVATFDDPIDPDYCQVTPDTGGRELATTYLEIDAAYVIDLEVVR